MGFKKIKGGRSALSEGTTFLSNVEYHGNQVPGVGKYQLNESSTTKKVPSWKWVPARKEKSVEKQKIGPGSYDDQKVYLGLKSRTLNATMPKVKRGDLWLKKDGRNSPGVGQYNLNASANIWKGPNMRRR